MTRTITVDDEVSLTIALDVTGEVDVRLPGVPGGYVWQLRELTGVHVHRMEPQAEALPAGVVGGAADWLVGFGAADVRDGRARLVLVRPWDPTVIQRELRLTFIPAPARSWDTHDWSLPAIAPKVSVEAREDRIVISGNRAGVRRK